MKNEMKRRNRPAATLIKEYSDKKSGKVSEARRELQQRFAHLDWSLQKKILTAHLQSCPSDRNWAYPRLMSLWDKSFQPIIEELWQTYHEERCSWIIVNHFSDDYLKSHLEELSQGRNYYFICRRLGADKQFPIDCSRLRPSDYLALMAYLKRPIEAPTAMKLVYAIAERECLSSHYLPMHRQWLEPRQIKPSPLMLDSLDRVHYYLHELPDHDALKLFETWCNRVTDDVLQSPEYKCLLQKPIGDDAFNEKVHTLLLKHMARHLPAETQKTTLSKMTKYNDTLEQLVHTFDLEEFVPQLPSSYF
jgi:hypothetical protein